MTDARGLTLVEMLVAMALMGMIATLLAGSLRTGVRAWEAGAGESERLERLVVVQNLLRQQIEAVMAGAGGQPALSGGQAQMAFVAPERMAGLGGLAALTLRLEGDRLLLDVSPLFPDGSTGEERTEPLLDGVREADFAYYGAEAPGQSARWLRQWQERPDLPVMVRIDLSLANGDWPPLLVRPAAGGRP